MHPAAFAGRIALNPAMQSIAKFFFTTGEGLALLALFAGSPVALVLMSARSIRPVHVAINGVLAALFGIPAALALSQVRPGDGMGALLFILVGAGGGLLALSFAVAALSTGLIIFFRRDGESHRPHRQSLRGGSSPSTPPLADQFNRWKVTHRRPTASYEDFLQDAHPRYFPSSAWTLAAAAAAMVLVGYLILR